MLFLTPSHLFRFWKIAKGTCAQAWSVAWLWAHLQISKPKSVWLLSNHWAHCHILGKLAGSGGCNPTFHCRTYCAVLPASFLCTDTAVLDTLSLLESARGSCPLVPACTMVRRHCRCWQAGMTDSWPSCQISSCVDTSCGGVVASAVLAGWLRKVQKNLLCGGTGVFLLPLLQPFST